MIFREVKSKISIMQIFIGLSGISYCIGIILFSGYIFHDYIARLGAIFFLLFGLFITVDIATKIFIVREKEVEIRRFLILYQVLNFNIIVWIRKFGNNVAMKFSNGKRYAIMVDIYRNGSILSKTLLEQIHSAKPDLEFDIGSTH